MAITKRRDILNHQIYVLGQMVATVTRQRDLEAEPFEADDTPAINLRDGDCRITHLVSQDEHELPVRLQVVTTSRVSIDEADELLARLLELIEQNDTWGGHADGTTVESHDIDLNQAGDTITAITVDIVIKYTTEKGKA